jgi:hypothetical protein
LKIEIKSINKSHNRFDYKKIRENNSKSEIKDILIEISVKENVNKIK